MALNGGTRLGPYEIVALLGAGGMGEVYRARDSKLDRDVAIKVLPDALAHDPERLARFEREAKTLAALNHPNIAHIHGFEDSTGVPALVMELVEGPTLADRVAKGPIPIDEALPIAKQIAEALEAAHEQGIIHRDLKPANIKVRDDGTVKVLDFGLAKALDPVGSARASVTMSPTLSVHATQAGIILGTAAYMSPEQARGKTVDRRADIWAFGVVLYEMLAGGRAFEGETLTDVIAAVVTREPDWTALPSSTPSGVNRLLIRCLRKDPKTRLRDIGDARIELEERSENERVESGTLRRASRGMRVLPWAIAATAISAAVWFALRPASAPPRHTTRFPVGLPGDAALVLGTNQNQIFMALSPDGTRLVYTAADVSGFPRLYVRMLDEVVASLPLAGTEGGNSPFFSPDGQWIGFNSIDGKLKKVPAAGGAPLTIADVAANRGAIWTADDSIVFSRNPTRSFWRVAAAGGTPVEWAKPDVAREAGFAWPEALPGGKAILLAVQRPGADFNGAAVAVMRLDTGEHRVLVEGGTSPHYLSGGYLLFARGGSIFAAPFDVRTLQLRGAATPVLNGVSMNAPNGNAGLAVSASGTAAYLTGSLGAGTRLVWVDRHGQVEPIDAPPQNYEFPRLSPDGSRVAVQITGSSASGLRDIWLYEFSRGTTSRLTTEKDEAETPVWTPDGKRVTYTVTRSGRREFVWKLADGSGGEETLGGNDRHLHIGSWSPDGRALVSEATNGGPDAGSLWILSAPPSPKLTGFLRTPPQMQAPAVSPDGRWIAYSANDTTRFEIYVQAFPGPGSKYAISTDGGAEPVWARSGRELFYRGGDKMMAVSIAPASGGLQIGRPVVLFEGRFAAGVGNFRDTWYDVSVDGQRFLMVKPIESRTTNGMIVVQDWISELQTRVPVGK